MSEPQEAHVSLSDLASVHAVKNALEIEMISYLVAKRNEGITGIISFRVVLVPSMVGEKSDSSIKSE